MLARIGLTLVAATSLAACSTFQSAPSRALDPNADLAAIESTMSATAVADCLTGRGPVVAMDVPGGAPAVQARASFEGSQECRNRIVTARKYAIDVRFSQFEQEYFSQNRWAGFGATLLALGLTAAGSLSGTGTAQALSAAASGVTGGRAAYEKEILAERSLITIDAAMHAQRDLIATNIRDGLAKSVSEYPLGAALSDLDAYYRAGTVLGALTAVSETVGAQANAAEALLRNPLPVTRTSAAQFLQALIQTGSEPANAANEDRIRAQMRQLGVSDRVTVSRFVRFGDPAQVEVVARSLGWTAASAGVTSTPPAPTQLGPADRPPLRSPPTRPAPALAPAASVPTPQPATTGTGAVPPPSPRAETGPTAVQFLRGLLQTGNEQTNATNEDRIRAQMRSAGVSDRITVSRFIFSGDARLDNVAKALGWNP